MCLSGKESKMSRYIDAEKRLPELVEQIEDAIKEQLEKFNI